MVTYWLDGVEAKLMRKRTITKRDQATLYQQNKNSPSFSRLIRESPKVPRHKLYVTPTTGDFARTPPLNPPPSKERALNYLKKPLSMACKRQRSIKNSHVEMVDYTNSNETQSLLLTNGVAFSSPSANESNNGNEITNGPRPIWFVEKFSRCGVIVSWSAEDYIQFIDAHWPGLNYQLQQQNLNGFKKKIKANARTAIT